MSWERIIETTAEELAYREKHFHDVRIIKDRQIVCTTCGNELKIKKKQIFSHPSIKILQCEVCWNYLKKVRFDKNKRKYCYICGKNEKLHVCCNKDCFAAFCKRCIKRNVSLSLLDAKKQDWKCFICDPKPIWDLRAICAAVINSLPKKSNKRSNKIEKHILPSQVQQIENTGEVQTVLQTLCEDNSSKKFIFTRFTQKDTKNRTNHNTSSVQQKTVDLIDLSSENSSYTNESLSVSCNRDKQSKRNQKVKSTRDSSSRLVVEQKISKSVVKEKDTSRRYKISSDSNESTDSSSKVITQKRIKFEKIMKRKTNSNRVYSSDSESDEKDITRALSISKRISKDTRQQNKKMSNSCNAKSKEYYDSTSESEDEVHKRRNREKNSETRRMTSHSSNDERKCNKSLTGSRLSNVQKSDSDNSSSKEFQKIKLQRVNRNKYSTRQLVDLEIDYTKPSSIKNSANDESEKHTNEQSNRNFNDIKQILRDCKKICSNFQMYIETIEQLYGKRDKKQLILKSTEKIDKLRTMLEEKQKNLKTSYQLWSRNREKSATKRPYKIVSSDESSEEYEKRMMDNKDKYISSDEQDGKAVSECDSEEIFSANETKTLQKTQHKADTLDTLRTENNVNNNQTNTDDEDRMSTDESRNSDKNMDMREDLTSSPVLGIGDTLKEKKTSSERSHKKQLFFERNKNNNKIQLTKENTNDKQASLHTDIHNDETEIEDSLSRDNEKGTLGDYRVNKSNKKSMINESMDMFDTSLEDAGKNRTEVEIEINCDKAELLYTSKDKFLEPCESLLQDKVSSEEDNQTSLLSCNVEKKKKLLSQNDQDKITSVTSEDDSKASGKTNTDNNESLDEAEALAKEDLLATDFDDTFDTLPNENVAKLSEDLITKDINRTEKKNEMEDNDSDVNSVSTVMLSTFMKETNTKVEKKSDDRLDKRSHKEISSSSEDAKTEKVAEKDLVKSNSDDSTLLLSESGKLTNKKSGSDSGKNAKAKLSMFPNESFSPELALSETTNASKSVKRNHEPESEDGESMVTRLKKKRFKLNKNHYYKNDKKLRMSCKVYLTRLSAEILKRHSRALKKSREYLENRALKSLVNLDTLEKKRKKNIKRDSDSLTDDDLASKISKSSHKQKGKAKATEESLMDHLKRLESINSSSITEIDSDSEKSVFQTNKIHEYMPVSNEALISEADRIAKENLLNFSDSNEKEAIMDSDDSINNDDKDKIVQNKKKRYQKKAVEKTSKQNNSKKDNWRRDKILTMKFSSNFDNNSEAERKKWEKKQEKIVNKSKENNSDSDEERSFKSKKKKKKKKVRSISDSDSDVKITDLDSESSEVSSAKQNSSDSESYLRKEKARRKLKWKKRKHCDNNLSNTDSSFDKERPKLKQIKKAASDSDSSIIEIKNSQGSTGKSGRKNIRKVLKDKQVAEDTKLAAKEEEERLKRIAERHTKCNEMRLADEKKVQKLVLDFDMETKEELVTVHEELVKCLKPHQAKGIKFMWDACFESLERLKNTSGSGCIIAHCMGLGKTLQVITLTHTLLTHEATNIKTVLIICPLSTVLNWRNEYNTWLKNLNDIEVYELTKFKKNFERRCQLQRWQRTGGVMIIGYGMFRNLTGPNKNIQKDMKEVILKCLINPGADLIVCDEGHLLKNEDSALSKCIRNVKTMRRIVLTGTPLQNNLIEYHCMVQFVKPNLLGTKKEFLNRFANPITNGQFDDSTAYDVKLMKKRSHVLHKMLEGSVQRFDYSVLTPFLPPKQEYVIFVRLTDTQIKMYQYYLENLAKRHSNQGGTLFADFQALQRIWTHPIVLRLNMEKIEKVNEKKELFSDLESLLKDFINHDTIDISNSNDSSNDSVQVIDDEKDCLNVPRCETRNNPEEKPEEPEEEIKEENTKWWSQFVQPEHFEDMRVSAKLLLLFGILKECEQIGDKVLVFSQSLYSLTLIEKFLKRINDQTQSGAPCDALDNHTGSWSLGLDYFRLDGQTSPENRNLWCKTFNRPANTRARLFLISTRAGGLGINLTAANRVIIFDASWNPSNDVQSIFRIYRFGQKKPCYVYRFLAAGTMEEKIYNRQVTKLSLSCRVIDEQQIKRHYSNHNLNELYIFEGYNNKEKSTLILPTDRLLAEIFLKFKDFVENYHEHDSLLENKTEEELNEEERKQAWLEYEEEKKGKPVNPMINTSDVNTVNQNDTYLQQYMMMNFAQSNMMHQNAVSLQFENLQQLIRENYPDATSEQQKIMMNQILMYNYWNQALYNKAPVQPTQNPLLTSQNPQGPNFQQRPQVPNNSNQQISQLNQLLSGQPVNYVNANEVPQSSGAQMGDLLSNTFTYQNTLPTNNINGNTNQDIIELTSTTSYVNVTHQSGMSSIQVTAQPIDNSKIQEE